MAAILRVIAAVLATGSPVHSTFSRSGGAALDVSPMWGFVPPVRPIPLLDTHQRDSIRHQFGSIRNLRIDEANDRLLGDLHFASDPDSVVAFTKCDEGHVRSVSVGLLPFRRERLSPGQSAIIEGHRFEAPANESMLVYPAWTLVEASICAIGADAKALTLV